MEIIAKCPVCGLAGRLKGSAIDRRMRCRNCGRLFKVPNPEQLSKAMKVITTAKGTIYVDEKGDVYG